MNSDYKEQCWKRYLENQKYKKYDKEDLVDEIMKLQEENQQLKKNRDKAIEILECIPINANGGEILEVERKTLHILKGDSE